MFTKRIQDIYKNFEALKRKNYLILQSLILASLFFIGFALFLYHYFEILKMSIENPYLSFLMFSAKFGLDLSLVLIPTSIALYSIKKNFKKKKDTLFTLKEKLL